MADIHGRGLTLYAAHMKLKGSAVIGQSGGPTVVINQSLVGYVEEAVAAESIDRVLGARHGVQGMMTGGLVNLGS